jgi:hypothetical protein
MRTWSSPTTATAEISHTNASSAAAPDTADKAAAAEDPPMVLLKMLRM